MSAVAKELIPLATSSKQPLHLVAVDNVVPVAINNLLQAGQLRWFHWLIVCLSLILTISAWHITKSHVNKIAEERFYREAEQQVEMVKERMALYENALWGAAAMINSNRGETSYTKWLDYYRSLNIDNAYPGINGIGVILNIQPDELDEHLEFEREDRPDYRLHPTHNEAEYWPIVYVEPFELNNKAVGLDMAFETNRYTAIKRARDTGLAQVTGPITLVQDAKKTPGFLFYAPFYKHGLETNDIDRRRENIIGVTYAPFIMYKLLQGTLASENRHVSFDISDQGEPLYLESETDPGNNIDSNPLYTKDVGVEMYGREWTFHIASNLRFRQAATSAQPALILTSGIIIDTLLLALFLFMSKAKSQADQTTRELRTQTEQLEKSNADLEQFAYIASHDLKSPLNAINKLVSWIEEDMGDKIPSNSREHFRLLRSRSQRMTMLLNDLLCYSRVGQLESTCETIHLKKMAEDIFSLLDKPEEFVIRAQDFELYLPRVPFELVLRNMISNAVKHSDKSLGTVEVTSRTHGSCYQVKIQDDGPGIPPELHDKALEMFQTLKSRDKTEGSGMGLALAKKILQRYNGSLEIESQRTCGTGIVITWPFPEGNNLPKEKGDRL